MRLGLSGSCTTGWQKRLPTMNKVRLLLLSVTTVAAQLTSVFAHATVLFCTNFMQSVLARLVPAITTPDSPTSLSSSPLVVQSCLAMLDLLGYRIVRLRSISDVTKVSTLPFEMFVACHLSFRRALQSICESHLPLLCDLLAHAHAHAVRCPDSRVAGASAALDENLKRATLAASQREYSAALEAIAGEVESAVANEVPSLESSLTVALILIRDGPEGKLAVPCLW